MGALQKEWAWFSFGAGRDVMSLLNVKTLLKVFSLVIKYAHFTLVASIKRYMWKLGM